VTPLAVIRHGPTEWNLDKRLQGRTDVPLSPEGRDLVSNWKVHPPVTQYQWVCSPLRRAHETAELLGATNIAIESRLIEMSYGDWEGDRLDDLRARLGKEMAENEARGIDFRPEGGETPRDVQKRLNSWLTDLSRDEQPTVAVTHHGVLRALYALATGWNMVEPLPEKFHWGAMHFFQVDKTGGVQVDRINVDISLR